MKKLLILTLMLFSFNAFSAQGAFFSVEDTAVSNTSGKVEVKSPAYSLQIVLTGTTFNVDVKLQTSIDETNWVDITDAESLAVSTATSIMFDISVGRHKFVRAVVTRNSGTYTVKGYLANGGQW